MEGEQKAAVYVPVQSQRLMARFLFFQSEAQSEG